MSRVVRRPNSRIKNVKKKGERARDLSNSGSSSVLSFSNKVSRLSSPYGTSVNFHSQSHLFKKHIKAPNPLIGSLTLSKSSDKDLRNSF